MKGRVLRLLLVALLMLGTTACLFEKEPTYAEFRIRDKHDRIELLGFARLDSPEDCETRRQLVLEKFTRNCKGCDAEYVGHCMSTMPERYAKLFDNVQIHATYLIFERGRDRDERDARMVIFGVPSSLAVQICPKVRERYKSTYSGTVSCVQGTVG